MNRTNLFAVAALALGVFACERNADRTSETKTTSAAQPVDNAGTKTPAPLAPADTSININADAKDAGHASIRKSGTTTTTGGTITPDMDMKAKDGGHRIMPDKQLGPDGPDHTGGSPMR